LLELVRYLHLNPLRAQVVPDLRALGRREFVERVRRELAGEQPRVRPSLLWRLPQRGSCSGSVKAQESDQKRWWEVVVAPP
jgi:hypothetical protein